MPPPSKMKQPAAKRVLTIKQPQQPRSMPMDDKSVKQQPVMMRVRPTAYEMKADKEKTSAVQYRLLLRALRCKENHFALQPLIEDSAILTSQQVELDWITEDDVKEINKYEDKIVYVLPAVEGSVFDHLNALKVRIWTARVLDYCLRKETRLPTSPRVLHSMSFDSQVVSFTGFDRDTKNREEARIRMMGGNVRSEYADDVDILIAKNCEPNPKYRAACCWKKNVCTLKLIDAMWSKEFKHVTDYVNKSKNDFKMSIFTDCVICPSGVNTNERTYIGQLIEEYGGRFTLDLARNQCTHLVVETPTGAKYKAAKAWDIHIVTQRWLRRSVERSIRLPEEYYHPDPALNKSITTTAMQKTEIPCTPAPSTDQPAPTIFAAPSPRPVSTISKHETESTREFIANTSLPRQSRPPSAPAPLDMLALNDGSTIEQPPTVQLEPTAEQTPSIQIEPITEQTPTAEQTPSIQIEPTTEQAPTAEPVSITNPQSTIEPEPTINFEPTKELTPPFEPEAMSVSDAASERASTIKPTNEHTTNAQSELTTEQMHTAKSLSNIDVRPSDEPGSIHQPELISKPASIHELASVHEPELAIETVLVHAPEPTNESEPTINLEPTIHLEPTKELTPPFEPEAMSVSDVASEPAPTVKSPEEEKTAINDEPAAEAVLHDAQPTTLNDPPMHEVVKSNAPLQRVTYASDVAAPLFMDLSHSYSQYSGAASKPRRLRLRINKNNWTSQHLDLSNGSNPEQPDTTPVVAAATAAGNDSTLHESYIMTALEKASVRHQMPSEAPSQASRTTRIRKSKH